jgi:alcohol dehydrogenase (cytochrome c)
MRHSIWRRARATAVVAATAAALASPVWAGTSEMDLKRDATTPDDVLTYGMGYNHQRFSPLTQINKGNIKNMVPVWNLSLDNQLNASTQPLVADGVMYVATHNATVAVDAITGKTKWKTPIELPADVNGFLCCGVHTRGLAIQDGVIYRTSIDAHVLAINAADGKQMWKSKVADYKEGYSMTHAPLIANGVIITGISGAEYGIRGHLKGWDPKTGKELWTRYTVAGPGEKGADTWAPEAYKHGGASTWITGSYDPDLDLVYWGTGNGGPWNPQMRGNMDGLYLCSVLAIRPKTGEIAWHFQFTPNDPYDYDSVNEMVLADIKVGGKPTKALMNINRAGYLYVLDRTNGKLLAANQYVKTQNWSNGIDMKTGRPIDNDMTKMVKATLEMKDHIEVWPNVFGGKNWQPSSYSPKTGLMYANTLNFGWKYKTVKQEYKKGEWFLGVDIGGWVEPKDGNRGYLSAIDPLTGKSKWEVPTKVPFWSGVASTAGGVVFTGAQTGEFLAYDADNGKKLWQFQTGSGIVGVPIVWSAKGKQYVTITSGQASVYAALGGDPNLPPVPSGSSLWTFALPSK